jgi:hypothetical protein
MATTITIELPAEDLRWPKRCVCCGGLDESDIEVVVPDTVDANRPIEEVITADVPHCLDCRRHMEMGFGLMPVVAMILVVCFLAGALMAAMPAHGYAFAAGGFIGVLLIVGADQVRIRGHMKHECVAARHAFRFVHPCGRDITTILFMNDSFAREFRALNGRGVYEP